MPRRLLPQLRSSYSAHADRRSCLKAKVGWVEFIRSASLSPRSRYQSYGVTTSVNRMAACEPMDAQGSVTEYQTAAILAKAANDFAFIFGV